MTTSNLLHLPPRKTFHDISIYSMLQYAAIKREMENMVSSNLLPVQGFGLEGKHCRAKVFSSCLNAREKQLICVTSGNSFLGSCIVKELLARGYLVRVTIQNQEDFEGIKLLMTDEEINKLESIVVAKMHDLESLCNAFSGCHAVFHTSSFIDPHGVTGYSEQMAFSETEGAKNVIEACGSAAYVRRCIFTSSLLAAIWPDGNLDMVIDESSWSNQDFCRDNKLWLALGKTGAEKAAWSKSKELKVKLVTLCPGLLMATSFPYAHEQTSMPYLKGGSVMLRRGVLAISDVKKVAEAHVQVYEAMDYGACGRYFCFQKVVSRLDDAIALENELKMHGLLSRERNGHSVEATEEIKSNLSNSKIAKLLLQASCRLSGK
ncbi:hypothetical protein Tsubulata_005093 [Turnera subulata]|uniref:3-beta hydroxysteroid dehydrogenase/isomerase domain-containing protein n=1 Tax=Turnera subulata TaxID=218843 RepID=A0A9Q0FM48_9ROSI|nr:hypothetical protein Tsubulata_005093 [Turnera subulata]